MQSRALRVPKLMRACEQIQMKNRSREAAAGGVASHLRECACHLRSGQDREKGGGWR